GVIRIGRAARAVRTGGGAPTGTATCRLRCRSTRPGCDWGQSASGALRAPFAPKAVLLQAQLPADSVVGAPAPGAIGGNPHWACCARRSHRRRCSYSDSYLRTPL